MTTAGAALVAIVLSVTDGDTLRARVPHWSGTPLGVVGIRVLNLDTPESEVGQAKCAKELVLGKEAKAYAERLVPPNTRLRFFYKKPDKYGGRVVGSVTLPDGRDFATVMISAGMGRPYDGKKKGSWCQ